MNSYPIDSVIPALREAVSVNSCVVLHAPPGAGKTTRVPLALLDIFPPEKGRILILEPRRIAAVSAAGWMARTLGERPGETVGYTIRFESRVTPKTRVEVMTEGILTRRIQSSPGLDGVGMIIFDEFHERSLQVDLALALSLDVQQALRNDLRILVMSATLDCGPIASLLSAPVISSVGQAFPVEERYLADRPGGPLTEDVLRAVTKALNETRGDILVFLPGSGEISRCSQVLKTAVADKAMITVHPLYGDLSFEEQERAILPSGSRKIILATNIAETSLTIEGVSAVIDSGLTRRLRYDPSTGMNRLVTVSVSKASAEQRKGRAGRLGPGICYRLYSRQALNSMLPFAPPEILVSDLSSLCLELAVWGVKDRSGLFWLDPPPAPAWDSGRRLLRDLGALDREGSATALGREMSRLPLHPRLGRLILKAAEMGCTGLGADIAALLSERDILRRGASDRSMAYGGSLEINERLWILQRWRKDKSEAAGADPAAIQRVEKISGQLIRLVASNRKAFTEGKYTDDLVSRLLLSAFPDRIAMRREEGEGRYILSQGRGVKLPGKSRMGDSRFIVAANLDAGEGSEGMVHLAAALTEEDIRRECSAGIETLRRIELDKREGRIVAVIEERIGAVILSVKPFSPSDEESAKLICEAIKDDHGLISFSREARQFQHRVALIKRTFPDEEWADLSDGLLLAVPDEWLLPWLRGVRTIKALAKTDLLPALRAKFTWKQQRLIDERAPAAVVVPSGHSVMIDYVSGDVPVLAVKLQEMFGLADTPMIAEGRVRVLLHLLSPARRPVQITQDLKGFWDNGYQQVKKELKGRYPKHPWPDDPWKAVPTRRAKQRDKKT